MKVCLFFAVGLAAIAGRFAAADDWPAGRATVRFDVEVYEQPSEAAAGVVAFLPDGGQLPPHARVFAQTGDGRPLTAEVIWHNRREGLGVVFEPLPNGAKVRLYVEPGSQAGGAATKSRFMPSLLLFTQMGGAGLDVAGRIGRSDPPGERAAMGLVKQVGHMENPWGPDDDFSAWYSGWLRVPVSGRIYFCTVSDEGSEARLNGKVVASWPGLHTRQAGGKGQFGSMATLTAGVYRVEYAWFDKTGLQEANLCWRLPGSTNPLPETIPAEHFLHSGQARVIGVETRDGRPFAAFRAECVSYLWVHENPVYLFRLRAWLTERHPADVEYRWQWGGGVARATGQELMWISATEGPQEVVLRVGRGAVDLAVAAGSLVVATTPKAASVNAPSDRADYREALLARCRAVPPPHRPCADWSPDLWATAVAVQDPYKGMGLLKELFERSRPDLLGQPAEWRWELEDYFYEALRLAEPGNVPAWVDRLESEERDRDRRFEWTLARVEHYLVDAPDTNAAARAAAELLARASGPMQGIRALVRRGDVERHVGNREAARALYAQAQDRFEEWRKAQRFQARAAAASGLPAVNEAWKGGAVREAAFRSTAQNLVKQGRYLEARRVFRQWETERPLSKLGGDYPLAEADFYMAIGAYGRAADVLKLYRKGVEISSELPEAMVMELECLRNLDRRQELEEVAREVIRRFPTLPAADRARRYL